MNQPSSCIEIDNGIFWVGATDEAGSLHCNPYLIVDHGEGVLIDPGSPLDFEAVFDNVTALIPLENIKYVISSLRSITLLMPTVGPKSRKVTPFSNASAIGGIADLSTY